MAEDEIRMLCIEDNEDDYLLIMRELKKDNMNVRSKRVEVATDLENLLRTQSWDIVLCDSNIPDKRITVESSLLISKQFHPNTPFIIVSGTIGEERAVQCMKLGANEYILKDNLTRLNASIRRELNEAKLRVAKLESENRLIESEANYRNLAESITDMFFAIDKNYKCTYWNKAAESITGLHAEAAIGKTIKELIPANLAPHIRTELFQALSMCSSTTINFDIIYGNKLKYFSALIYSSSDGHTIIIKDVTEQKAVESKLAAASQELETFMYRVSHDIRGPVASLIGLIEITKHEPIDLLAKSYFEHAGLMVSKLDRSIQALMVISGIKHEDLDLRAVELAKLLADLKSKWEPNNDSFRIALEFDSTPVIKSDAKYLQMIFEEIVRNAQIYQMPRAQATLRISIKVTVKSIKIYFEDNGIGMSPSISEKAFNMFYKGSDLSKGEGLGLYLAKNLVEKLSGSISLKSQERLGTTVCVELPIG